MTRDPLFAEGGYEVQDVASQYACALVASLAEGRQDALIVDYCAGGGGKTLGIAAQAPGARIVACDTNSRRLGNLAPRARRAGVDGLEIRLLDGAREGEAVADLFEKADVVLVDAPCLGTGTWRRAPDLIWRTTPARLAAMAATQRAILGRAMALVRPGGSLVYAVCSVTTAETDGVVEAALATPGWRLGVVELPGNAGDPTRYGRLLTPARWGSDGFYLARLDRTDGAR